MELKNQTFTFCLEDHELKVLPSSGHLMLSYDTPSDSMIFQQSPIQLQAYLANPQIRIWHHGSGTSMVCRLEQRKFRNCVQSFAYDSEGDDVNVYVRLSVFRKMKAAVTLLLYNGPDRPDVVSIIDRLKAQSQMPAKIVINNFT